MLIIDAHVHLYNCFDLELLFDSAFKNFQKHASRLKSGDDFCGVLLLAEKTEQNFFSNLLESINNGANKYIGRWKINQTEEPFTLKLTTGSGETLFLIQGRQFNSKEGLEVLSLLTDKDLSDNLPLENIVDEIIEQQGIPVVPWAFGKWLGKRGRLLEEFINGRTKQMLYLGDNGGRPSLYFSGLLSKYKNNKNIKIVSGSDPLPLKNEEHRVGSFGVYVEISPKKKKIGAQIIELLRNPDCQFTRYGKASGILECLRNQFLLRR